MSRVGALFAATTAMLEDMHAVSVEGQASDLSADEQLSLLSLLRSGAGRLERHVAAASKVLN